MSDLDQAVEFLKSGRAVVFPTETAYGLAVDATNLKAVQRLYRMKGRIFNNPIHVIFPSFAATAKAVAINKQARILMKKYWPGPLTLVLPLKSRAASFQKLSAGTKNLGVRSPKFKPAQDLVKKFGRPITATSANISGQPTCYSVAEIRKQFAKAKLRPDYYIDSGKLPKAKPSTVVAISKNQVQLLREGPIALIEIKNLVK